jgi:hypothetical protein
MYSSIFDILHNTDDFKNKNGSDDKKIDIQKEDITSSIQETVQAMLTNENVFKIVVIIIACLNKLHHSGNLD